MIPYGKHHIDEDDIQAVVDVLRNRPLTQGPKVAEFENVVSQYTGAKYAVAVSSGTAALHLSCNAAGISKGDSAVTSPNTFVASANCIIYNGGTPEFVDIDYATLNMDIQQLRDKCERLQKVKAILPVHYAGLPCEMAKINKISREIDAIVIEDASHALGATYKDGGRVGNCCFSDMTVFSFHPVKGIASGEGGMITTNNEELYHKLLRLRSHGICKGNFDLPGISQLDNQLLKPDRAIENGELRMWYYEMQELGFNYRLTDIQSALAISQMNKISDFLARRRELVANYDKLFQTIDEINPAQLQGRKQSSHHLYVVFINYEQHQLSRHKLMKQLFNAGIGTQVHYIPVPMHPYYESLGYDISDYPVTYKHYQTALSIPLYYELSNKDQDKVVKSLIKLLTEK